MAENAKMVEIKQLLGAMIFAAARPVGIQEMRKCLVEVAKTVGGETAVFADVKESNIRQALEELAVEVREKSRIGFHLAEIAGGYRFQTDTSCGKWIKHLLEIERPTRLSGPALETLAIIAYRQPAMKSEIEGVRGVNVDHIIKALLELRLVKIVGRSDLPGHPFLFGTTQLFLEHFGLKNLGDLKDIEPMLLASREIGGKLSRTKAAPASETPGEKSGETGAPSPEVVAGDKAQEEDADASEDEEDDEDEYDVDDDEDDEDDEDGDDEKDEDNKD